MIKYCSTDYDDINSATDELLRECRPDAIFCLYDYCSSIVMGAIHNFGLSIPNDIAIMGYDNIPLSRFFSIPISTIDTHGKEVGIKATELLIEKIKNPDMPSKQIVIKPNLVIRQSTVRTADIQKP